MDVSFETLSFECFQDLMKTDPDAIKKLDGNQRTIIHWAALKGKEELVAYALKEFKDRIDINQRDDTQTPPLILATLGGHIGIVKMLVENGADINAQNWNGHSSLQYACSKGWLNIVEYLLKYGANINIRDKYGDTCLHRSVSLNRVDILELLLQNSEKPDVNSQNVIGNTPLFFACEDDNTQCALLLIKYGADINIENKEKHTPLFISKPALRNAITTKIDQMKM